MEKEKNYIECPKCERRVEEGAKNCPYCQYDLVNKPKIEKEENNNFTKFKSFIKKKALIIESILAVIIVVMFVTVMGTSGEKETLEKQYNDLKAKSEETTKTLNDEIRQKENKIKDNEKKVTELQQEDKKNEINESIRLLETEKQKLEEEKKTLEGEKQTLTNQIEELKKTSSILIERKNAKVSQNSSSNSNPNASSSASSKLTTTAQNTNSEIVYITNTGKKYHKSGCSYLKKSKIETTMSNAVSSGYTPCSKCY